MILSILLFSFVALTSVAYAADFMMTVSPSYSKHSQHKDRLLGNQFVHKKFISDKDENFLACDYTYFTRNIQLMTKSTMSTIASDKLFLFYVDRDGNVCITIDYQTCYLSFGTNFVTFSLEVDDYTAIYAKGIITCRHKATRDILYLVNAMKHRAGELIFTKNLPKSIWIVSSFVFPFKHIYTHVLDFEVLKFGFFNQRRGHTFMQRRNEIGFLSYTPIIGFTVVDTMADAFEMHVIYNAIIFKSKLCKYFFSNYPISHVYSYDGEHDSAGLLYINEDALKYMKQDKTSDSVVHLDVISGRLLSIRDGYLGILFSRIVGETNRYKLEFFVTKDKHKAILLYRANNRTWYACRQGSVYSLNFGFGYIEATEQRCNYAIRSLDGTLEITPNKPVDTRVIMAILLPCDSGIYEIFGENKWLYLSYDDMDVVRVCSTAEETQATRIKNIRAESLRRRAVLEGINMDLSARKKDAILTIALETIVILLYCAAIYFFWILYFSRMFNG